jgi:hypothetical protein
MTFNVIKRPDPRNKAYELMEEGIVTPEQMAQACLQYMSWDDIEDMLHTNQMVEEEELMEDEE